TGSSAFLTVAATFPPLIAQITTFFSSHPVCVKTAVPASIRCTGVMVAQHAAPDDFSQGAACCAPTESPDRYIIIEGGAGIGRVTKPGLAVPVGKWAINPVPRRMIEEAIREVFPPQPSAFSLHCLISIPNGEELAKKTLNERLGIVGGLSILGTTGIVRPVSARAWTDTIDAAIDVALACGSTTVVLSTGRTSEMVAERHLRGAESGEGLPEEAFVMMGDHVGHALRACARKGVRSVVIAGQFAKLLKIACGHEQTHASSSELDLRMLAEWLSLEPRTSNLEPLAKRANTAREVLVTSGNDPELIGLVCGRVREFAEKLAPGVAMKVLLAGYRGEVLYFG
ncbi:MAG TPA: cobalt-precorrin-5B (C(1))-methyltransferase CbiD, partial [Geobacteraceae bacterium]